MGKLALSLDTMRLKWGITAAPQPKKSELKEINSDKKKISAATNNQLKKRRPKKGRR